MIPTMPDSKPGALPASETLGVRVRRTREARGIGQSELADMIKVRPQTVWRIESGESPGSRATVSAIAKALEVDEAWLRYGVNTEATTKVTPKGVPVTISEYLASAIGSDTSKETREILERVDWELFGVKLPTLRDVHRMRETIEALQTSRHNSSDGADQ